MDSTILNTSISLNPSEDFSEIRRKIGDFHNRILQNDAKCENLKRELVIVEESLVKMRLDATIAEFQRDAMLEKLLEVENNAANKKAELQKVYDDLQDKMEAFHKDYSDEIMEALLKGVNPPEASYDPDARKKKLEKIRRKGRMEALLFYKSIQEKFLKNLQDNNN